MTSFLEVTVSCYENEIPSFVASELDRLYGGRYASLAHFHIYRLARNASTFVARRFGEAISVLLFQRQKNKVRVLNEGIRIGQDEARCFTEYIFATYPSVTIVVFHAVQTEVKDFPFPYQLIACGEDTVLSMPDTVHAYLNGLGKSTRDNMKRYLNRLKREFPTFAYRVHEKEEVDEQDIRDIIRLNRSRMTQKSKVPAIDEEEERRIILYVRQSGFVGVATIDGRFCGGVITYRLGQNYSLRILAHDPLFDDCRLGLVCCFLTICESIKQGGSKNFYFGWGEYAYKCRLGGTARPLHRLVAYRSRFHVVLNPGSALSALLSERALRLRLLLAEAALRDGKVSAGLANKVIKLARWLRMTKAHYRSSKNNA